MQPTRCARSPGNQTPAEISAETTLEDVPARLFLLGTFLASLAWSQNLAINRVTVIDTTGKPAQPLHDRLN